MQDESLQDLPTLNSTSQATPTFESAVTNVRAVALHGLPVGPVPLSTTPVSLHCAHARHERCEMADPTASVWRSARAVPLRAPLRLRSTPARRQPDRSLVKRQKTRGVPLRRSTKRRWAIHKQPASSLMSSTRKLGALSTAGIAGAPTIGRSGLNSATAFIRIESTRRDQRPLRSTFPARRPQTEANHHHGGRRAKRRNSACRSNNSRVRAISAATSDSLGKAVRYPRTSPFVLIAKPHLTSIASDSASKTTSLGPTEWAVAVSAR